MLQRVKILIVENELQVAGALKSMGRFCLVYYISGVVKHQPQAKN